MSTRVEIQGLDRVMAKIKRMGDASKLFDPVFARETRQSVRRLADTTNKRTGTTAHGWQLPQKLGDSRYAINNGVRSGKVSIPRILNAGRGEIRPRNSKFLYIPLTNKGASKPLGAPIPNGLVYGVDYVLTKKAKAFKGTQFIQKEVDKAGKNLGQGILARFREVTNGTA